VSRSTTPNPERSANAGARSDIAPVTPKPGVQFLTFHGVTDRGPVRLHEIGIGINCCSPVDGDETTITGEAGFTVTNSTYLVLPA
jgi:hypothetical protein